MKITDKIKSQKTTQQQQQQQQNKQTKAENDKGAQKLWWKGES